jgi:hypothetical protein
VKAIPVETISLLAVLNLPGEMADNGIFTEHESLVLEMLRSIVTQDSFERAVDEDLPENDPLFVSFRFGFCFLMLHSTAEFLNLKTLGEGIVKTVGLDQSATELLTGSEIDAFKANLELRALTVLSSYLNQTGLDRLNELKPRTPRVIRVGVI